MRLVKYSVVSIPPELWNEWGMQCYFIRYFNISVETSQQKEFLLAQKGKTTSLPGDFQKIELNTLKYDLYRKKLSSQ